MCLQALKHLDILGEGLGTFQRHFDMNNFYTMFLTLMFLTSNASGYYCQFLSYSEDIKMVDINGRQIYILFGSHSKGKADEFQDILNSGTDIIEKTNRFMDNYSSRINSERSDFQQITSLLTSQEIDWVGVEYYPNLQTIERVVQSYQNTKESFNQISNGLWNPEKTDDLLYLLYPFWLRFLTEHLSDAVLNRRIRIIPLENETLYTRAGTLTMIAQLSIKFIHDNINLTGPQTSALVDFLSNPISDTSILIDSSDTEDFFKTHGIEDPETRNKIRTYIDLLNETITAHQERDEFVVQKILRQEGNGIVLRGSAHQQNVESGLTQVCLNSKNL